MLRAAALASEVETGPGLTCEILTVPWAVSWPDTSQALNAELIDTTFRPALLVPPSAARLKTATWRGLRCGFGADRDARGYGYGNGLGHGSSCSTGLTYREREPGPGRPCGSCRMPANW